jgi:hypothetical protein
MFSAYCKQCGTVVLLDSRCIRSVHTTSVGIVVYFRCYAGHSGVRLVSRPTGRTFDAGAAGVTGEVAAPSRVIPSRTARRRRSWWSRREGRRPNQTRPGVASRHGDLRAG